MKTLILFFCLSQSVVFAQQEQQYVDRKIEREILLQKEYIDARFDAITRAVDKVAVTNENAISKVEANSIDYRAQQNEWRGQLRDANATFVTRVELWSVAGSVIGLTLAALAIAVNYNKNKLKQS
jgi:DNA-binding protein